MHGRFAVEWRRRLCAAALRLHAASLASCSSFTFDDHARGPLHSLSTLCIQTGWPPAAIPAHPDSPPLLNLPAQPTCAGGDLIKPAKNIAPPPAAAAPRAAAQKQQQLPSLRATKKPVRKQLSGSTHFTAHVPTPDAGPGGGRGLLGDSLGVGGGGGAKTFAQEQASCCSVVDMLVSKPRCGVAQVDVHA